MKMFITYDLEQAAGPASESQKSKLARAAKPISIPGKFTRWEVGEFENASGAMSYGVRVHYVDSEVGAVSGFELIEVPANAQNVNVHAELPREYQAALSSAA